MLPHIDQIASSFGAEHDLPNVEAHVGGAAAASSAMLGAEAYTIGDRIGFRSAPDLRTAAHEAAHVVQQRQGIDLAFGPSSERDAAERAADVIADRVVSGRSAEDLLGPRRASSTRGSLSNAIQLKKEDDERRALQKWGESVTTALATSESATGATGVQPATISMKLPPDGVGSVWFRATSPTPPPFLIRVAVLLTDGTQELDSMMTAWYPEVSDNRLDERYRLQVQSTGRLKGAIGFADLANGGFKSTVWNLDVSAPSGGSAPPNAPSAGEQPEYIVTGAPSDAGAGGTNFFFAGAGHDIESTGYIEGFRKAFSHAGIGGFTDVNVSSGSRVGDIASTLALYSGPTQQTIPAATAVVTATGAAMARVARGQRNLIGYSFGGAVAAAVARNLVTLGIDVDNLVLIGTPISVAFLRGLQLDRKITRVIVVNMPSDIIRPGSSPAIIDAASIGPGSPSPHFYFAEGDVNQTRREQLARVLYALGLR